MKSNNINETDNKNVSRVEDNENNNKPVIEKNSA